MDFVKMLIVWGPTLLFILIVLAGFILGLIRGLKKSSILFIQMLVAFIICLSVFLWMVNDPNLDSNLVNFINSILGYFDNSLQKILDVDESLGTIQQMLMQKLLATTSEENIIYYLILDNGAYFATIVQLAYRLILFIVSIVLYLLLIFIFYMIYLIWYPVRRTVNKYEIKFANGEIKTPYKKRRLLGGLVGIVRSLIVGVFVFSFLGTLIFIVTGGTELASRSEIKEDGEVVDFNDNLYNSIYDYYSYVCEASNTGIFQVLNGIKDQEQIPYYFYFADVVLQGNFNDETLGVNDKLYLRDETGYYVKFVKKVSVIMLKYFDVNILLNNNLSGTELSEYLMERFNDPGFVEEFSLCIDEFESQPFTTSICLSSLTSLVNHIDLAVEDESIVELVNTIFKGENSIKVTDLATEGDIKSLFKALVFVVAESNTNETVKSNSVKTASESNSSDSLNTEMIEFICKSAAKLSDAIANLTIFNENKAAGNKIISSVYEFCGKKVANESVNLPEVPTDIEWTNEFKNLLNCVEPITKITLNVMGDNSDQMLENLLYLFSKENASEMEASYDEIVDNVSNSVFLDVVLKSSMVGEAIDNLIVNMTNNQEASIPKNIDYSGDAGECKLLLTAIKDFIKNDGADIYYEYLDNEEINEVIINKAFAILKKDLYPNDPNNNSTLLDSFLSSKVLSYTISSYVQYATLGDIQIYLPESSYDELVEQQGEITKTFKIIHTSEIRMIIDAVLNCPDIIVGALNDPENINYAAICSNEYILNVLDESKILQGTIASLLISVSNNQDTIILPLGYDNVENWISDDITKDGEINLLVSAVRDIANIKDENGEPIINSLLAGKFDYNSLLGIENETIVKLCSSKVLQYTVSGLINKLSTPDFEIVVPMVSISEANAETTKQDETVNVISGNELANIISQIKTIVKFDENSKPIVQYNNIFNNKAQIISNMTIQATLINLLVTVAESNSDFMVVPQRYKTDFEKIKTDVNLTGNVWFGNNDQVEDDELYIMLSAVESIIEKNPDGSLPEDFDLLNDFVSIIKIKEESIDTICSSQILNASLSRTIVTSLKTPAEVYNNEVIDITEIVSLLDIAFDVLNKTVISLSDFSDFNIDTLMLTKPAMVKIADSKILLATLSYYIVGVEEVVIPLSVASMEDIVTTSETPETIGVIEKEEYSNLVEVLFILFANAEGTISISNLAVDTISVNQADLAQITSSMVITATLSNFLVAPDGEQSIYVPDTETAVEKTNVVGKEETQTIVKKSEITAVLNVAFELFETTTISIKDFTDFDFNSLKIKRDIIDTLKSSEIIMTTVSKFLGNIENILIPTSVTEEVNLVNSEVKVQVISNDGEDSEYNKLMRVVFDLFATDDAVVLSSIDPNSITISSSEVNDLVASKIITATISNFVTTNESIVVPATSVDNTKMVDNTTKYVIKNDDDQLTELLNILVEILGTKEADSAEKVLNVNSINVDNISIDKTLKNRIIASNILRATFSNYIIGSASTGVVIPETNTSIEPINVINKTEEEQIITETEISAVLDIVFDLLGVTTISINDFNDLDFSNLEIKKSMVAEFKKSEIIMATVSKQILSIESLFIPVVVTKEIPVINSVDTINVVDSIGADSEYDCLMNAIFTLFATADVIKINAIDPSNIVITKEVVSDLLASKIIDATISNYIVTNESIVVPATSVDNTEMIDNTTKYVIKNNEKQFTELLGILIDIFGETPPESSTKELRVDSINAANITVHKDLKDKVVESDILRATFSKFIIDSDGGIIIPEKTNVLENIDIINSETQETIITKLELNGLLDNAFNLFAVDDKIEINNFNAANITITSANVGTLSSSEIINATVSKQIVNVDKIITPLSVIEQVSTTKSENCVIIEKEEFVSLMSLLLSLLGGEIDTSTLNIDTITLSTSTDLTNSEILTATMSKCILETSALTIPNSTVVFSVPIYAKDAGSESADIINETDLKQFIEGIICVLSEGDSLSLKLESNLINTDEITITKDDITVSSKITSSKILQATISTNITNVTALVVKQSVTTLTDIFHSGSKYILNADEFTNIFNAIFALLDTNEIKVSALSTSFNSISISNDNMSDILNSSVMASTISSKIISMDTLTILTDVVEKNITILNSGTIDLIKDDEVKSFLTKALELLGRKLDVQQAFSINDIQLSESLITSALGSSILHATISKNITDIESLFIEESIVTIQDLYEYGTINQVTFSEIEKLFGGMFALLGKTSVTISELSGISFSSLNSTKINKMLESTILCSTISKKLVDIDFLVKPSNIKETKSFVDKGDQDVIVTAEVKALFDSMFVTTSGDINIEENFNISKITLPDSKDKAEKMVESLIISATLSKQITGAASSSVVILDESMTQYTYNEKTSDESYIDRNDLATLLVAMTVGLGMNSNNFVIGSIKIPNEASKVDALVDSEIIRATISKAVFNNAGVAVSVDSGEAYEIKQLSENDVVVLKENEIKCLINGATLLGSGDFDNISINLESVLTATNKVDLLNAIALSAVYRALFSSSLSAVYAVLSMNTSEAGLTLTLLDGGTQHKTYRYEFTIAGYRIKDPVSKDTYNSFDATSKTMQDLFTDWDILALQNIISV